MTEEKKTTITKWDTVYIASPVANDSTITDYIVRWLPTAKEKREGSADEHHQELVVNDTSPDKVFQPPNDSAAVIIPIVQNKYEGDEYTAWNKAIRVMSISKLDKATPMNSWKPYQAWLLNGRYPFVRTIYALLNDPKRGLPWGFAHFIEQPRGQMIVFKAGLLPTRGEIAIRDVNVWTGYDTTLMSDLRYDERGIYVEPAHVVQDLEQVSFAGFTVGDYKAMSDGTYFERLQEDNTALATRLFGKGKVMQGWMSAEICYNFDEGRWEVLTTGGAMRFGKEIELAIVKQRFKPVLYNYSVTLRGGLVVTLETAIRYAEALGSGQGTAEMIQAINDYLTSIRVNAFIM